MHSFRYAKFQPLSCQIDLQMHFGISIGVALRSIIPSWMTMIFQCDWKKQRSLNLNNLPSLGDRDPWRQPADLQSHLFTLQLTHLRL